MPARGRCCAPARQMSTCWCSPGLSIRPAALYSAGQGFSAGRGKSRHGTTMTTKANATTTTEVIVYTRDYCGYSDAAKALLQRKGIAFTEINATGNRELRAEMI